MFYWNKSAYKGTACHRYAPAVSTCMYDCMLSREALPLLPDTLFAAEFL